MQVTELMPVSKFVNLEVKFQLMLMVLARQEMMIESEVLQVRLISEASYGGSYPGTER